MLEAITKFINEWAFNTMEEKSYFADISSQECATSGFASVPDWHNDWGALADYQVPAEDGITNNLFE